MKSIFVLVILSFISKSVFAKTTASTEGKAYCIQGALESHVEKDVFMAGSQCPADLTAPQGKCVYTILMNRIQDNIMFAASDCRDVTTLSMAICLEGAIKSGAEKDLFMAKSACESALH